MAAAYRGAGEEIPTNRDAKGDSYGDKLIRARDCAVIEYMHARIANKISSEIKEKGFSETRLFDSTRSVFTEGGHA